MMGLGLAFLAIFVSSGDVVGQMIDNGNGTVTDSRTGLMWLKQSHPVTGEASMSWKEAMLWAAGLNFAGYNDWRLPSALDVTTGTPDLLWYSTKN